MELSARIAEHERRWSITVGAPFPGLTYHWVAPAVTRDGASVVLKLGKPTPELTSEIAALRAWAGQGAVRLLDADAAAGALLLERLQPGTTLVALPDDEATTVAIALMHVLHGTPPPPDVPTLADWTDGIDRARAAGFAPPLIDHAVRLRGELVASAPAPVLLHGDLHHTNILAAERAPWLAIDPKGVAGDPAYEPASFLYNPMERVLADPTLIERRVDRFAQAFDRRRVLAWSFVQSVLSAWWTVEDQDGDHRPALRFAELVAKIR